MKKKLRREFAKDDLLGLFKWLMLIRVSGPVRSPRPIIITLAT